MMLLGVFGLALLGIVGATAVYIVLRFSLNGPASAVWALIGWTATLVGTCFYIMQLVADYISRL